MAMTQKELAAEARAMTAQGKYARALDLRRLAVQQAPASSAAQHNLAAALGDLGRWREAEPHIRLALSLGSSAPETVLLYARICQGLARFEEAERHLVDALTLRPDFADAQRDLAQLRWMRTGDLAFALSAVEARLRETPNAPHLLVLKAQVHEYAGDIAGSYEQMLALSRAAPEDAFIATVASQIAAIHGDASTALTLARRAVERAPEQSTAQIALIVAELGLGLADEAARHADAAGAVDPTNQHIIAMQATAWRLLGDARYRALYDYDADVGVYQLATPKGWPDLESYLRDVAQALHLVHNYRTHPFGQSVRHGTQAPDVMHADHPALKVLPEAFDGPLMQHIAKLGRGEDALRSRNEGGYVSQGMWSIRMNAGGFHVDHVHHRGWISSATYIETPDVSIGHEGWLRFGHPGIATTPPLAAERYVQPAPGKVVFFPSYMWHGTEPYTDKKVRMTVAYDVTPGPAGWPDNR